MITHFKGNRSPSITDTIKVDGAAFDLTGSTVKFKMRQEMSATLKVDAAATIVTPAAGAVRYDWAALDVDTAGTFIFWWEVTLPSGKTQDTPAGILQMLDHVPAQVTNYIDREWLKSSLTLTGETYGDADIDSAIASGSRAADDFCGRRFYADVNATQVRYYTPTSSRLLLIDDVVTVTTLKTDSSGDGTFETTWTVNTDYVLNPLNAAADGVPWSWISVSPTSSRYFPCYARSVELTGKFGWAEVPSAVKQATSLIASRLLKRSREAPFGIAFVGSLDVGAASRIARVDPDVQGLLAPYVRPPALA